MADKCPICKSDLVLIPGGVSKKPPYKPYNSFMGCPNKCKKPIQQGVDTQMIMDALVGMNNRLDKLAEYLKSKFN